jgi:tetratricopeptide (TPR) repeat protein
MSEKSTALNKIISGGVMILAFLTPLLFLPFTSDIYEFNKNALLIFGTFLLLALWGLRIALEKKIAFKRTALDLPVLVFAATFVLSTIFSATNKWETFWTPLGTGNIISLTILYFIITNNIKKNSVNLLLKSLTVAASLLSLLTIFQFISAKVMPKASFFLLGVNPAGASLTALTTFLLITVAICGLRLWPEIKNRKFFSFFTIPGIIILIGLGISAWQIFVVNKPLIIPQSIAWAIATEAFKNWRLFLIGVGPTSFFDAFSQLRPVSYNLTNFWGIRFTLSSNYYFQLLSTIGIIGLLSFLWLIFKTVKSQTKEMNLGLAVPIFLIFFVLLFVFPNFLLLFTLFILLALLFTNEKDSNEYAENSKVAPWILFGFATLIMLGSYYLIGRAYIGEIYFKKSLIAIQKNEGTNAYNLQIKALKFNPVNDVYHLYYSQTNFALAYSLAQKSNISDQDRQNITDLVQQAIKEAKLAVSLNKNKVVNWENLASIYRQLLNFAQGAEEWTISSLNQAINLDPVNPNLRLTLGGVYYALGNFDEAIRFFQQAIEVKPNFANGYYNLSAAYREKGDFKKAHEAMQITLNLVSPNSDDYNKAKGELEDLAKKVSAKEATQSAQGQKEEAPQQEPLVEPQPMPSPVITPPIELPVQSAPDISPAPSATQ